ncbi:MAG: phage baseplate protein [Clostridiales bacterium]|jgi:hypothetical protein|nr:phage baseplate protein [Clostridiales bacterium]
MERFTLHTADKRRSYSLNTRKALAAEPKGLGNKFAVSYKETADKKYMTNRKPDFEPIALKIYFNADGSGGDANYKNLMGFISACGNAPFLFEYADGAGKRYCDVVLSGAPKSEISEDGLFAEDFTFDRLSYWYEEVEESFALKSVHNGGKFPLRFPFGFAGKVFINSFAVKNDFYEAAPVVITITGRTAANILVYVAERESGDIVGEVSLSVNSADGVKIVINAVTKKITVDDGETVTNGYGLTDKTKQNFLFIPPGEYTVGANISQEDSGEIDVSIKRYLLI